MLLSVQYVMCLIRLRRGQNLCRTLLKQIANSDFHSLHYLSPAKRDTQLTSRLRSTTVYPHVVNGQIDLKIWFYFIHGLTTLCLCVRLFLSIFWLPNHNKCYVRLTQITSHSFDSLDNCYFIIVNYFNALITILVWFYNEA